MLNADLIVKYYQLIATMQAYESGFKMSRILSHFSLHANSNYLVNKLKCLQFLTVAIHHLNCLVNFLKGIFVHYFKSSFKQVVIHFEFTFKNYRYGYFKMISHFGLLCPFLVTIQNQLIRYQCNYL